MSTAGTRLASPRRGASITRQGRRRELIWTTAPRSRAELRRDGFHVVTWDRVCREIARSRAVGAERTSLRNPADGLLRRFVRHARVAVLDVRCGDVASVAGLYGYVLEPAYRRGCTLLVQADRDLDTVTAADLADAIWRYPWTLERLAHLAARYRVPASVSEPPRVDWRRRLRGRLSPGGDSGSSRRSRLDPEQEAAVRAGDGVVQVIAPAGSGKTTVLIARVRELIARGTPPARILCATFNRDACVEIKARLDRAGVGAVEVRSFHGLGLAILRAEGRLRGGIGTPSLAQWRRFARLAFEAEPDGVRLDAAAVQNAVSAYKLAAMITPAEALARAATAAERTAARVYDLHERHLAAAGQHDFDDLIAASVALLQRDAAVRARWQARFERVLVDEYQDIEPAQALLVGLLAAPQDSLFCVGDEDQCIYAWRRASVQRVIELDQVYPGLQRFPLVRNYRCGRRITRASRRLIRHNRRRFRKPLHAGAAQAGSIRVHAVDDRPQGAALVAALIGKAARGEAVVLARTSPLLRETALACARAGIRFAASDKVLPVGGPRAVVAAYLRLLAEPGCAAAADVTQVFRAPNRSLPEGGAVRIADRLRTGTSFAQSVGGLAVEPWRRARLAAAAALLDDLAAVRSAPALLAELRGRGGLDRHLAAQAALDPTGQAGVDVLAELSVEARGLTVAELAARVDREADLLRAHQDAAAVELATVHAAKGREWDQVVLFGADEAQFPHAQMAASEAGVEDERRLFYVALTRAKLRLDIVCSRDRRSRFLGDAGL